MDQQQIEMLATNAVKNFILRSDYLSPLINDGNTEPTWDGHIYLYKEPGRKKEGIRRIPVQVKGTTGKHKRIDGKIKHPVKIVDLRNYLADGGVMYFVVLISSNGTAYAIYYSDLLPLRIRRELDNADGEQKKMTLEFKQLPDDVVTMKAIMESFYKHKEMQASIATVDLAELPSIEKLQEADVLRGITMTTASVHETNDPVKALLQDESYIYAKVKGTEIPIPVDMIGGGSEQRVYYQVNKSVSVDCTVYYENYQIVRSAKETKLMLGKSTTLTTPAFEEPQGNEESVRVGGSITFTPCKFLRQRCKDMIFWLHFLETRNLKLGGKALHYEVDWDGMKYDIEKGKLALEYYRDLIQVLDTLGISQDIDYTEMTDYDRREFDVLVRSLIKKQLVGPMRDDLELNYAINLCGLTIALIHYESIESDGLSTVKSFFDDSIAVSFTIEGSEHFAPSFATLNKERWIKIANIEYNRVLPAFQRIYDKEHDPMIFEIANNSLLSLLLAYDEIGREDMLSAAIELAGWIQCNAPEYTLSNHVAVINYCQAIRRGQELSKREKRQLQLLIEDAATESKDKIGAYLLLDNQDAAEMHFERLSEKEKVIFKKWPIYRFWNNHAY